ncbi:hypothetical protein AC579_9809 [Pseudocercospora musae]|uniref:Uncharacterized protein n=1 Tax=Pseudocercospora musae TaxID=113226 RepID=A0A139IVH2_9PEZI|nr:hypothetical protein AC579_9809 [Pseudocercospora musae]
MTYMFEDRVASLLQTEACSRPIITITGAIRISSRADVIAPELLTIMPRYDKQQLRCGCRVRSSGKGDADESSNSTTAV